MNYVLVRTNIHNSYDYLSFMLLNLCYKTFINVQNVVGFFLCHMLPLHILCRLLLLWIIPGFYSSKFFDFISLIRKQMNIKLKTG